MSYPSELKYSAEHEWVRVEGARGTVGITAFAVEQIGDIVFVELPPVGSTVTATKPFGVIESVKAVSELFAPASGTVVEVNTALNDAPETVAADCYGAGWLIRIEFTDPGELGSLMDASGYEAMLGTS
ncbi:MAG TPA: glycine cleavage system protein GcvH [Gemmatimonadales bacterium]|nr:glycine cleavage system protein GcvH [Gemmatimonadales bacterium]